MSWKSYTQLTLEQKISDHFRRLFSEILIY